jgi:hypothetical protein
LEALGELSEQDVLVAVQFSDASLDPIALIPGRLRQEVGHRHRFSVGDAVIVFRSADVLGGSWVEGRGEEPALKIDLREIQVTVSPASQEMADPLDG